MGHGIWEALDTGNCTVKGSVGKRDGRTRKEKEEEEEGESTPDATDVVL